MKIRSPFLESDTRTNTADRHTFASLRSVRAKSNWTKREVCYVVYIQMERQAKEIKKKTTMQHFSIQRQPNLEPRVGNHTRPLLFSVEQ